MIDGQQGLLSILVLYPVHTGIHSRVRTLHTKQARQLLNQRTHAEALVVAKADRARATAREAWLEETWCLDKQDGRSFSWILQNQNTGHCIQLTAKHRTFNRTYHSLS
jgi:hypothetical protein